MGTLGSSLESSNSQAVIHKLDVFFGVPGWKHTILIQGQDIDNGCLYWPLQQTGFVEDMYRADETLFQVRKMTQEDQVIAYKGELGWVGIDQTDTSRLVVAPTIDQFDVLHFEQTDGANYLLDTEDIIEKLSELNTQYGVNITGASPGSVEFFLKQIPQGKDADQLGEWLVELCPDLRTPPTEFGDGRIALWWD